MTQTEPIAETTPEASISTAQQTIQPPAPHLIDLSQTASEHSQTEQPVQTTPVKKEKPPGIVTSPRVSTEKGPAVMSYAGAVFKTGLLESLSPRSDVSVAEAVS